MSKTQNRQVANATQPVVPTETLPKTSESQTENMNSAPKKESKPKPKKGGKPRNVTSDNSKPTTTPSQASKADDKKKDSKDGKSPAVPETKKTQDGNKTEDKKEQKKKVPDVQRQVTQLNSNYALMKFAECKAIAHIDAPLVSTDPMKYVLHNANIYYIAINSWLLQVSDVLQDIRTVHMLRDQITAKGLLYVIKECQKVADTVIASYSEMGHPQLERGNIEQIFLRVAHKVDDQQLLQLLRYLKRFSPQDTTKLIGEALSSFFNVNERCGIWQRDKLTDWSGIPDTVHKPLFQHASSVSSTCEYLESRISWYLHDMMLNFEGFFNDPDNDLSPKFSSGASQEGRLKSDKIKGYASRVPHWMSVEYPFQADEASIQFDIVARKAIKRVKCIKPVYSSKGDKPVIRREKFIYEYISKERSGVYETREKYSVTPQSVPKSYKTARIIASESAYHGAELQKVKYAMEQSLAWSPYTNMFDPKTQEPNRDSCQEGSIWDTYSTIDLSGASDSISRSLGYRIMPRAVTRAIERHMARYLKMKDGTLVLSKMYATSGCPITFVTLGCICLAICLVAADIYYSVTHEKVRIAYVFGDDCCVDSRIYQLVCDIFTRLGFVINADKSYSSLSTYRESCGSEFTCGYDLTTKYFPRTTLNFSEDEKMKTLSSIVDLQHKLFDLSWSAQRFLADVCDTLASPQILTRSLPGSHSADIWSEIELHKFKLEPYDLSRGGVPKSTLNTIEAYNATCAPDDRILFRESKDSSRLEILVPYSSAFEAKVKKRPSKDGKAGKPAVPDSNMNMYYYASWLKHGPKYDEPLLELLGIPSKLRKDLDCNLSITALTYSQS